jgi:hypothetical protein
LLCLIDDQGNEVWKNIFGNPRGYDPKFILDECYGVRETLDGGFVVTGGTGDHSDYFGLVIQMEHLMTGKFCYLSLIKMAT